MPIYDYKCRTCGDRFEIEQSITDDALTTRPGCTRGDECDLKKVFHPVGIAFKGSGFYKNDARGKGSSTSTADSGGSSSGSSSSDSSSTAGSSSSGGASSSSSSSD